MDHSTATAQYSDLEVLLDQAKSLALLKDMSEAHLAQLLSECQSDWLFAGQVLFERGSFDRQHIYLLHGDMELQYADGRSELIKGRQMIAPIANVQPRNCRAQALSDCRTLKIDSARLDQLLSWSQVADYLQLDISYQPDLDDDMEWMMTVIRSNLFQKVPPTNVEQIFSRLQPQEVSAGQVILRQGEIGDGCYFIKDGRAQVTRSSDGVSRPQWVADISVGRCFGEDALVNETVRNATVTMLDDGVIMRLEKRDFLSLLREPEVTECDLAELESGDWTLLDVRTAEEYQWGHLHRAVNMPLRLLRLQSRQLDKSRRYLLYCDSGRRSRAAVHLLSRQGYQVAVLKGADKILASDQSDESTWRLQNGIAVEG